MRALIFALAALPACTLYEPNDGDDYAYWPDAGRWQIDAGPWMQPDAQPPDDPCAQALPCPSASADRFSMCGRVHDVETGNGVTSSSLTLGITFHDALAYVQDPMTSTPLVAADVTLDECGRFTASNIPVPQLNQLAVVVDDAVNAPDNHRATVVGFYAGRGESRTQTRIYSLRTSTDDAWATQANLTESFADQGAVLGLFGEPFGEPGGGVRITADGDVRAADDYYFSTVTSRATVLPSATTTNPNGAALLLNSTLVEHSGTGGELNGCYWTRSLAASIPGVLWVQPFSAECPI